MRSILKTDWVKTDVSGYSGLGRTGILQLEKGLCEEKWWQDIGLVHPVEVRVNGDLFEGNIYRLMKRGDVIAV
jgi:hypothetical protein